jgi:hypothetical protein
MVNMYNSKNYLVYMNLLEIMTSVIISTFDIPTYKKGL